MAIWRSVKLLATSILHLARVSRAIQYMVSGWGEQRKEGGGDRGRGTGEGGRRGRERDRRRGDRGEEREGR